ncbi:hypothetical protein GGI07_000211 [Coemansia sp. Benny D115]|nr:hypothetical protein GGI07_000211 [Coemansia sp. Benny D115]
MRSGGGGSHMESGGMGPGGQGMPSEHSMRYSPQMHGHPHSAMPIPVQQGQFSRPHSTQPGHPPRIRSPVHPGGFQQRHGGPPLPPQVQLPAPAFPTSHQGPSSGQQGPHSATRTPPQQQNVGQGPPGQALQPPAQQQGSLPTPRAQGSGPARLQGPPPGQPPVSFYPGAGPQGSQPPVHQPQPHQAQHGQGPHSGAPGPITSSSHGLPPPPPQQQQQQQHQQQPQNQVPPPPGQVAAYSQSSSPRAMTGGASYNRLKQKLQQRVPVFGVWLSIPSPMTARMLATQGFDWACIDMEHSPTNPTLMAEMVAAVASSGTCTPIVRLPSHSPEWFKWALDAGAHGVIVPMVNTPEEMHNINKMCRYPPHGKRTMGAFFAPSMFNLRGPRAMIEYVERASRDIMVIPQIESAEGVANLPSIVKVGGMDALFVGPYDLSASVRASQDMQYREALGYVEKVAQDNELPIGIYASSGSTAFSRLNDGYTLLVAASDIECLSSSAAENLERARGDGRQYR